jgi:zinc transport system substrate-binding protein
MSIGVPFEKAWMDRIQGANPKMPIVDTTEGIELLPMVAHHHHGEEEHHHHDHDLEDHDLEDHDLEDHDSENLDPHIWVSPQLVKLQAQTIYEALVELDPNRQSEYQASLQQFLADIDALDTEIRQNLAGVSSRKFMVFHPSWGYFARDYNLEMITIEIGGQEPSAAELAELIAEAKEEGIRVIFVQPEFSTEAAETDRQRNWRRGTQNQPVGTQLAEKFAQCFPDIRSSP